MSIDRIPYPRAIAVALLAFGLWNVYEVNAGWWSMLYWMPWAFGWKNPPTDAGILERGYLALMAFIGAFWGLMSTGFELEPAKLVAGGFLPAIGGAGLLVALRITGGESA